MASSMHDSRALRDAFGAFTTGVTIVTSVDGAGRRVGFTANSFTSVSLDPPLLLVAPARTASCLEPIRESGRFAVNVLARHHEMVARRFATRNVDRFATGSWRAGESGLMLLDGACATFECRLHADLPAGDHQLVLGLIEHFAHDPGPEPLIYRRGRYA